jgi:hypothetical protein
MDNIQYTIDKALDMELYENIVSKASDLKMYDNIMSNAKQLNERLIQTANATITDQADNIDQAVADSAKIGIFDNLSPNNQELYFFYIQDDYKKALDPVLKVATKCTYSVQQGRYGEIIYPNAKRKILQNYDLGVGISDWRVTKDTISDDMFDIPGSFCYYDGETILISHTDWGCTVACTVASYTKAAAVKVIKKYFKEFTKYIQRYETIRFKKNVLSDDKLKMLK